VEGLSGFAVLAIIYAVLTVIAKINQGRKQPPPQVPRRPPRVERPSPTVRRPAPRPEARRPPPPAVDTRQEGDQLEELLRGLGEIAGIPVPERDRVGRPTDRSLPSAEEVEERESLETEPRTVSLEGIVVRPDRRMVDQDDEAELIVQRRIREAEARNRSLTRADHQAFDTRIRAEPRVVATPDTRRSLREAIIWREILGPPKGLE